MDQRHLLKICYNNKGGVDLLDNLRSCYSIRSRNSKLYSGEHNWFLNVSMVQAWRFYKKVGVVTKDKNMEKISFLDFIRSCVKITVMLHGKNIIPHFPSVQSLENREEIKKDARNYMIIKISKKRICKHCHNRTSYQYRRCDVELRIDCFEKYPS